MEDMAQLERLVNRLAAAQQRPVVRLACASAVGTTHLHGSFVAPTESPVAADVVANMMATLAQDARLLPPMQLAVKKLEAPLKQLVRFDPRFFTDAGHPARRLLDEITQRSLAFTTEDAPGFAQFVRLVNEGVAHLAASPDQRLHAFRDRSAGTVFRVGHPGAAQESPGSGRQQARQRAEQRAMLAERVAADIRKLHDA